MQQLISFITLGVCDFSLMRNFYKHVLGWQTIKDEDGIIFFKMNPGLIFALFPDTELAKDIGIEFRDSNIPYKSFSLAINLESQKAVDDFVQFLILNGVHIQKMPEKVYWGGYRGYFADPENNFWEVAYNPLL